MNVPEKLASEISRVTAVRCRYEGLRGIQGANPEPAIYLMTLAINNGIKAAGVNDALTQMDALRELGEFTE